MSLAFSLHPGFTCTLSENHKTLDVSWGRHTFSFPCSTHNDKSLPQRPISIKLITGQTAKVELSEKVSRTAQVIIRYIELGQQQNSWPLTDGLTGGDLEKLFTAGLNILTPSSDMLDLSKLNLFSLPPESLSATLTSLNLNDNNLTALPESLGALEKLELLSLDHNNLTALPSSIGNAKQLTFISAKKNSLTALPESLGGLENLDTLILDHNNLTALPSSIGNAKKLTFISAKKNSLTALPESLGSLPKLEILTLCANKIRSLPPSFYQLIELDTLVTISLNSNRLSDQDVAYLNEESQLRYKLVQAQKQKP